MPSSSAPTEKTPHGLARYRLQASVKSFGLKGAIIAHAPIQLLVNPSHDGQVLDGLNMSVNGFSEDLGIYTVEVVADSLMVADL